MRINDADVQISTCTKYSKCLDSFTHLLLINKIVFLKDVFHSTSYLDMMCIRSFVG